MSRLTMAEIPCQPQSPRTGGEQVLSSFRPGFPGNLIFSPFFPSVSSTGDQKAQAGTGIYHVGKDDLDFV